MQTKKRKFNVTKEQILDGISKTKSVEELCKLLNLKYGTLYARCKEYKISLRCYITKWNIDDSKFWELYSEKYSDAQIGKILNIPGKIITEYRRKHKIPKRTVDEYILNDEQYQIFIGGMLGDSSMEKRDKENARMTFSHSLKQQEYALWKYNKLKDFCCTPRYYSEYDSRTNTTYKGICIKTHQNSYFSKFYNKFYYKNKNNKNIKYIDKKILFSMNELGLAVWFQDDGCKLKTAYSLATCCFSDVDIQLIKEFFLHKYNISVTVHKDKTIYIPTRYTKYFTFLIKPYIQPCCEYKLIL